MKGGAGAARSAGTWDWGLGNREKIGTRHQGPGTRDQAPGTRDQGPATRDQGPGTREDKTGKVGKMGKKGRKRESRGGKSQSLWGAGSCGFMPLCESLRIFANLCESLRIFANLCESLRFVANRCVWSRPSGEDRQNRERECGESQRIRANEEEETATSWRDRTYGFWLRSQWFPMVLNGIEWYRTVQNGIEWCSTVLNGCEWYSPPPGVPA